jgi:glucose-6-phosphate-specific signal transduction histidine kinase
MFRNAFNIYSKKTIKEAIIFYVFWLVISVLCLSILGVGLSFLEIVTENNIHIVSPSLMAIFVLYLNIKMLIEKRFIKPFIPIMIMIFSVPLTYYYGGWVGLLLVSATTIFDFNLKQ